MSGWHAHGTPPSGGLMDWKVDMSGVTNTTTVKERTWVSEMWIDDEHAGRGKVTQSEFGTSLATKRDAHPHWLGALVLECSCTEWKLRRPTDAPMCKHVDWVIKNDRDVLGSDNKPFPLNGGIVVDLLIRPDVTVLVRIIRDTPDARTGMLELKLGPDTSAGIGMIGLADGRRVIKERVWDWLVDVLDGQTFRCRSPYHFGENAFQFDDLLDNGFEQPALADAIGLLADGVCSVCRLDAGVPDLEMRSTAARQRLTQVGINRDDERMSGRS